MDAALTFPASELQKLPIAFRAIAGATGRAARDVLYGEAGVILKACAYETKVATQARTDASAIRRALGRKGLNLGSAPYPGDISVNMGTRGAFGRVWVRSQIALDEGGRPRRTAQPTRPYRLAGTIAQKSFNFRPERYHWRSKTWNDITDTVADVRFALSKAIPAARGAIALARQSWVQIADSLGIRLENVRGGRLSAAALAKARRAVASTGVAWVNGLGREERRAKSTLLTLINRYPRGRKLQMDATLQRVLTGRVRYFERNLELGVFNAIEKVARAYPYLRVENN